MLQEIRACPLRFYVGTLGGLIGCCSMCTCFSTHERLQDVCEYLIKCLHVLPSFSFQVSSWYRWPYLFLYLFCCKYILPLEQRRLGSVLFLNDKSSMLLASSRFNKWGHIKYIISPRQQKFNSSINVSRWQKPHKVDINLIWVTTILDFPAGNSKITFLSFFFLSFY